MCGDTHSLRSSIFSSEAYETNGSGARVIPLQIGPCPMSAGLGPSHHLHVAVSQTPLSISPLPDSNTR